MHQAIGDGRYIRQTSCPAYYGHVVLVVTDADDEQPFRVSWEVTEERIPYCFAEAVTDGLLEALAEACWTTSVHIRIIGGSYHAVDSSAPSYREAARRALRQALANMKSCG